MKMTLSDSEWLEVFEGTINTDLLGNFTETCSSRTYREKFYMFYKILNAYGLNEYDIIKIYVEGKSSGFVVTDKHTYYTLLDSIDILRIKTIIINVEKIQSVKNDVGVKISEYIPYFSSISRSIDSLSKREGSIRTSFTNFPWDDLEKVSQLLKSTMKADGIGQYEQYKTAFDLDLVELKLRLKYMVKVAELKNPEIEKALKVMTISEDQISIFENAYKKSIDKLLKEIQEADKELTFRSMNDDNMYTRASGKSEIQKALKIIPKKMRTTFTNKYKEKCKAILEFVHSEDTKSRGLQNIRRVTEPILDKENQCEILSLIAKAETCDPSLPKGRAALYGISLMISEMAKNISDQTKQQNANIPFEQLKAFRNTIHGFDKIANANKILECVKTNIEVFEKIKIFLTRDLKNKIEKLIVPDISSSNPTNPNTPLPANTLLPENIKQALEIIKQALPQNNRTSDLVKKKLKFCDDLLSGELPIPLINLQDFFSNIFADEISKNIIVGLNKNHDEVKNENRSKITEDIKYLTDCLKMLDENKFIPINKTKNTVQKVGCFEEFNQAVSPPANVNALAETEYIEKQLSILKSSLESINQETQVIVANVNNYESIREACSNPQFHYFHLFHLLVIGQCIQNLVGKDLFSQSATPELLIEFEFLKWVRNGLMHNQDITEVGTVFNYFKNDLLNLKIKEHGARTYDSDKYLDYLRPQIDETLYNINHSICVKSNMKALLLKHLELAYNSKECEVENLNINALIDPDSKAAELSRNSIWQSLKNDYGEGKNLEETECKVKEIINIVIKEKYFGDPHSKAKELLNKSTWLDLENVYDKRKSLEEIAKKYEVEIEGFLGELVNCEFGFKNKSGIFVKCNVDKNLPLFKKELTYLLSYRLLIITEDHLREYLNNQKSSDIESSYKNYIELVRGENSYKKVMGGAGLHFKIKRHADIEEVQELLQQGCNLDLIYQGYAPMHRVCNENKINAKLLKLLLDHGANPNVKDCRGKTPVHYAAEDNNIEVLKLLYNKNADFTITNHNGHTALDLCRLSDGHEKKVYEFLLPLSQQQPIEERIAIAIYEEDFNTLNKYFSELNEEKRKEVLNTETAKYGLIGHVACKKGNLEIIKLLEKNGCNLKLTSKDGATALEAACYDYGAKDKDRIKLITDLIDKWEIEITSIALHSSIFCPTKILMLLLDKGADPDVKGPNNWTPLVHLINENSINKRYMQNIKLLLKRGANILACDGYIGNTLHLAAERGHDEVAKLLLDHAKEKDQLDLLLQPSPKESLKCKGMNAYHIALKYKMSEVAEILKEYFPAANSETDDFFDNNFQIF